MSLQVKEMLDLTALRRQEGGLNGPSRRRADPAEIVVQILSGRVGILLFLGLLVVDTFCRFGDRNLAELQCLATALARKLGFWVNPPNPCVLLPEGE